MRVCVMGAGIGGLSTAHMLARKGHQVHVLERNPDVGGLARSRYLDNGEHSEYCWHVFMHGYTSLIPILQEIPFRDSNVADQLRPITQFGFGRDGDQYMLEYVNAFVTSNSPAVYFRGGKKLGYKFRYNDMWKMALIKLFVNASVPERFDKYDDIRWIDLMGSLSEDAKKWIVDPAGIYLGMETDRVNAHTMFHLLRESYVVPNFGQNYRQKNGIIPQYYSLNGPTNQHWLEPWKQFLTDKGISIQLNTKINQIRCEGGEVKEIVVSDANGERNLQYDIYVNCLDVLSFGKLLCGADAMKTRMLELSKLSYQIQPQITIHLQEKVHFGEPTIVILPDTAWTLMFRPEGPLWDVPLGKGKCPPAEVLAMGIGAWYQKGILYGKPARDCTEEELINEVWAQMKQSTGLMKHFKTDNHLTLNDIHYSSFNTWYSFSYDHERGKFDTWEPKFSNNVGTVALRPSTCQQDLTNLIHANAYTKTDANIFNMDSAAEAGIRAANFINFKQAKAEAIKYTPPTRFWSFCQGVDRILLKKGYSNPLEVLLNKP